jgi:hypothetical protein
MKLEIAKDWVGALQGKHRLPDMVVMADKLSRALDGNPN